MATSFGIDPTLDSNGKIVSGTSSRDIRKVIGGMYTQGILNGMAVTTSTTDLSYKISAGSAVNFISGGDGDEHVLLPGYPATITTAAGGTSPRVDYVYVKQNRPETEGNSNIVYGVTNTKPAEGDSRLVLKTFTVPAGMTRTSQASVSASVDYAVPRAAAGRVLLEKRDAYEGLMNARSYQSTILGGSIYLPSPRRVVIDIVSTYRNQASATVSDDFLVSAIYLNGKRDVTFASGNVDASKFTRTDCYTWTYELPAGTHSITVHKNSWAKDWASSSIYLFGGSSPTTTGFFPGQVLRVTDGGAID